MRALLLVLLLLLLLRPPAAAAAAAEEEEEEEQQQQEQPELRLQRVAQWQAEARQAQCLNGSAPVFYFREGGQRAEGRSRRWIVHFESGGWCRWGVADCMARAKTPKGSTRGIAGAKLRGLPDNMVFLSADPQVNALMHDWNVVFLRYCDGSSFTSNATWTGARGRQLHFRGHNILDLLLDTLIAPPYDMGNAMSVVVSGLSAGGMAAIMHADRFRSRLPGTRVVALAESGVFVDTDSARARSALGSAAAVQHYRECGFGSSMRRLVDLMDSVAGLHQACVAAARQGSSRAGGGGGGDLTVADCMFVEHMFQFSQTPTFLLQSQHDSWGLRDIACVNPTARNDARRFGHILAETVAFMVAQQPEKGHASAVDGCLRHGAHRITPSSVDSISPSFDPWNQVLYDVPEYGAKATVSARELVEAWLVKQLNLPWDSLPRYLQTDAHKTPLQPTHEQSRADYPCGACCVNYGP